MCAITVIDKERSLWRYFGKITFKARLKLVVISEPSTWESIPHGSSSWNEVDRMKPYFSPMESKGRESRSFNCTYNGCNGGVRIPDETKECRSPEHFPRKKRSNSVSLAKFRLWKKGCGKGKINNFPQIHVFAFELYQAWKLKTSHLPSKNHGNSSFSVWSG